MSDMTYNARARSPSRGTAVVICMDHAATATGDWATCANLAEAEFRFDCAHRTQPDDRLLWCTPTALHAPQFLCLHCALDEIAVVMARMRRPTAAMHRTAPQLK